MRWQGSSINSTGSSCSRRSLYENTPWALCHDPRGRSRGDVSEVVKLLGLMGQVAFNGGVAHFAVADAVVFAAKFLEFQSQFVVTPDAVRVMVPARFS